MTCREIEPDLVGYHFGVLDDRERAAVESHLVSCPDCVAAFVALKRAIEIGEQAARPSDAARARLRAAVAAELGLGVRPAHAPRRWWERPVALAVAASVVAVASATTNELTSGPGSPPYALSTGQVSGTDPDRGE